MPSTTVTININTPTGLPIATLIDTLCTYWGYQANLPDGTPNPQNKGAFVKAKVANFVRESYQAARANNDAEAARIASLTASALVTTD